MSSGDTSAATRRRLAADGRFRLRALLGGAIRNLLSVLEYPEYSQLSSAFRNF
jgi:hypothetical protein